MTYIAYFKTQRIVVENTGNINRYILNKIVIYAIYAVLQSVHFCFFYFDWNDGKQNVCFGCTCAIKCEVFKRPNKLKSLLQIAA